MLKKYFTKSEIIIQDLELLPVLFFNIHVVYVVSISFSSNRSRSKQLGICYLSKHTNDKIFCNENHLMIIWGKQFRIYLLWENYKLFTTFAGCKSVKHLCVQDKIKNVAG